jgi:hypothetical protein
MQMARVSMVIYMSSEKMRNQPVTVSIAPWLSVADAAQAVDFYKKAFGTVEMERLENAFK